MKKIFTKKLSPIFIAIVSTIVGIFFSNLLYWGTGALISDQNKTVLILVFLASLATLAGMLFVSLRSSEILDSEKEVATSQQELIQKMGVNARLLTYNSTSQYKNTFEYPTRLIKDAKEIIALDYQDAESTELISEQEPEYIAWYALLDNFAKRPGIKYKRIIQLKTGKSETLSSKNGFDPTAIAHFKTMTTCHKKNPEVRLMTSPIFLSHTCIIIIDRRYVIWEIPSIENDDIFRFEMDLAIEDPVGIFVRDLLIQFEKMVYESATVEHVA